MKNNKNLNFDADVYAAYLDGSATKEEMNRVLRDLMNNPRLIFELNMAASIIALEDEEFL